VVPRLPAPMRTRTGAPEATWSNILRRDLGLDHKRLGMPGDLHDRFALADHPAASPEAPTRPTSQRQRRSWTSSNKPARLNRRVAAAADLAAALVGTAGAGARTGAAGRVRGPGAQRVDAERVCWSSWSGCCRGRRYRPCRPCWCRGSLASPAVSFDTAPGLNPAVPGIELDPPPPVCATADSVPPSSRARTAVVTRDWVERTRGCGAPLLSLALVSGHASLRPNCSLRQQEPVPSPRPPPGLEFSDPAGVLLRR
jgi:hypothetical protein